MDRAAKAVRRSAGRIVHGESTHLNNAIEDWRKVSKVVCSLAGSQQNAAESLLKWSLQQENRAIRDVALHFNELSSIMCQIQNDYVMKFTDCLRELEAISDGDKALAAAEKDLQNCISKEAKLAKEARKTSPWKKGGDVRLIENQLEKVRQAHLTAEAKLQETKIEMEAIKMMRFKACMLKLAEAQQELNTTSIIVSEAHRDVAEQIPDITTENLMEMQYSGAAYTRDRVALVRDRVMQRFLRGGFRRATVGSITTQPNFCTNGPPPPYTAYAPRMSLPNAPYQGETLAESLYPKLR